MGTGRTSFINFSASRCLRLSSSDTSAIPPEEKHIPMIQEKYIAICTKGNQAGALGPRCKWDKSGEAIKPGGDKGDKRLDALHRACTECEIEGERRANSGQQRRASGYVPTGKWPSDRSRTRLYPQMFTLRVKITW